MSRFLHRMAVKGEIDWLSFSFAEFICRQAGESIDSPLAQSAALVSEANLAGDVCVELKHYQDKTLFPGENQADTERMEDADRWISQLLDTGVVSGPDKDNPIIVDDGRLYLQRNWRYETSVANKLLGRMETPGSIQQADLISTIEPLFLNSKPEENDQKAAVTKAIERQFSVISGGPGTGKTTTVVKILAAILSLRPESRIALSAPTGKAAARMIASIKSRIDQIEIDENIRQLVPLESATLHRLLGFSQNRFRHHEKHRLPYDCVIVDEASMIDLRLMFQLLEALPDHSRLILLGDRDQLASVAAGNVLGDITGHGRSLDQASGQLQDSISLLTHSYRFEASSDIARLASLVNQGNAHAALEQLDQNNKATLWFQAADRSLTENSLKMVLEAYRGVLTAVNPADAIDQFERFRVLATLNQGPHGVIELNRLISQKLLNQQNSVNSELFQAMPIIVNRNHHDLGLYNGDTGILWEQNGLMYACFNDAANNLRWIRLNRLRDFSPAWVTTVHKSQGSEFDTVLLVLPEDSESESLSRELLYTAITRAKTRFVLQGNRGVVQSMIKKLTRRHSGLAERLGW
ncbi:MAG: exodeoxyribonuclease V subunit alpha [Pseudomonadota bacterium]